MKTYGIYNLTTGEVLADNLTFEDIPELFEAYVNFYKNCDIVACYSMTRNNKQHKATRFSKKEFTIEWFDFIEEPIILDNIY